MDCEYWKDIVAKLKTQSYWASHVLSTCISEESSNLSEALKCVSEEEVIENTIFAYEDWNAQPYCDQILFKFEKEKIIQVFTAIKTPTENMKKGYLYVIEDLENGLSDNTSN
jgi:hypothetical protein